MLTGRATDSTSRRSTQLAGRRPCADRRNLALTVSIRIYRAVTGQPSATQCPTTSVLHRSGALLRNARTVSVVVNRREAIRLPRMASMEHSGERVPAETARRQTERSPEGAQTTNSQTRRRSRALRELSLPAPRVPIPTSTTQCNATRRPLQVDQLEASAPAVLVGSHLCEPARCWLGTNERPRHRRNILTRVQLTAHSLAVCAAHARFATRRAGFVSTGRDGAPGLLSRFRSWSAASFPSCGRRADSKVKPAWRARAQFRFRCVA